MICATCLVRDHASDESKDRLIRWQAVQLHRLTGGMYEEPDLDAFDDLAADEPPQAPDLLPTLEGVLNGDGVFRRPGRVAAPRVVEGLAAAGFTITKELQ